MSAPVPFTDSNQFVLEPDKFITDQAAKGRFSIRDQIKRSGLRAPEETQILQNQAWISEHTGIPFKRVIQNWDTLRSGWADRLGFDGANTDDTKFNAYVQQRAKQSKATHVMRYGEDGDTEEANASREASLSSLAYKAGVDWNADPEESFAQFQKWQEQAKTKPDYDPKEAQGDYAIWSDRFHEGRRDGEVANPVAEETYRILTEADNDRRKAREAVPLWRGLTQEQRKVAIGKIQELGKKHGSTVEGQGAGAQAGTALIRSLKGMATSLDRGFYRDQLLSLKFEEGFSGTEGLDPKEVIDKYMAQTYMSKPGAFGGYTISKEQADALNAEVQQRLADLQMEAELGNLASSSVNPLRRDTWYQKMAVGGAESLGAMAVIATPVGFAAATNAYRNDAVEKYVSAGIPVEKAQTLGWVTGPAQGALDRASLGLLKKMPGLNALLNKWSTSTVAKAAGGLAGGAVAETAIELTQDQIVPAVVQDVAAWWDSEVPGVKWDTVKNDIYNQSWDTFLATLPLVLVGVGNASFRDYKNFKAIASDPTLLKDFGYKPEHIKAILSTKTDQEAAAAVKRYYTQREPKKEKTTMLDKVFSFLNLPKLPSADSADGDSTLVEQIRGVHDDDEKENAGAEKENVEALQRSLLEGENEAETLGNEPVTDEGYVQEDKSTVMRDYPLHYDDNGWSVLTPDGKRIDVGSVDAALHLQKGLKRAADESQAKAMVDIAEEIFRRDAKAGDRSVQIFTGDTVQFNRGSEATRTGPEGTQRPIQFNPESFQRQLDALSPGTDTAYMQGRNWVAEDGTRFYESNQSQEGPITVLHEFVEGRFRKLLDEDGGKMAQEAARAVLPIFQGKPDEFTARLQQVADGTADPDVMRETMVDLVVADTMGRRKDGTRMPAGTLTEALRNTIQFHTGAGKTKDKQGRQRLADRLATLLSAVREYLRGVLSVAAKLNKARRDGKLKEGDEFHTFANKLLGIDETQDQAAHDKAVIKENGGSESFSIKVYRAGDSHEKGIKPWASFSEEKSTAEAYLDNPGYGGDTLREETVDPQNVLDADTTTRSGMADFAEAIGFDREVAEDWFTDGWRYPWEESSKVKESAAERFDAIRYKEDYPAGTTSIVFTKPIESYSIGSSDLLEKVARRAEGMRSTPEEGLKITESIAQEVRGIRRAIRFNEAGETAVEDLKAQQELEMGGAIEDGWSKLERENLELRHKIELSALQAKADAKEMTRTLRALDSILFKLPAEIRAKIGGFTQLSTLKTDAAREKFFLGRMDKIEKELEKYLKAEYTERLTDLIEKGQPDAKGGEKAKGTIGPEAHRFFAEVDKVKGLSADEVEASQGALEKLYEADGITDAERANIFERQQVLDTFGNLKGKSAADLANALKLAQDIYTTGRNKWRTQEEMRLADVAAKAKTIIDTLGRGKYSATQAQKDDEKSTGAKSRGLKLDTKSFSGILRHLFGDEHPLTKEWAKRTREGYTFTEDARRKLTKEWDAAVQKATGEPGRKGRRMVWDMANEQTIELTLEGEETSKTETIPVSVAQNLSDGTVKPEAVGLTDEQAKEVVETLRENQANRGKEGYTAKPLEVKKTERTGEDTTKLSEADGIFVSMLAGQEQYAAAMAAAGFTPAVLKDLESKLSPAAKQLRSFMARKYESGYLPLNKVFARMFGVDLAQIPGYAPAAFYHTGTDKMKGPDETVPEGGFRAGFLKTRKQHKAAPRLENAFATFFGHQAQSSHWQGFAELIREMKGVLGRPEVKRSIEGAHGENGVGILNDWVRALEGNGIQKAHGVYDKFTGWLLRQAAYIQLGWKFSTLAVQSTAALGAAFKIPAWAYLRGMGRLLSGRLSKSFAEMRKSDVIRRRVENGASPELRAALGDEWTGKPTVVRDFLNKGLENLGSVDGYFTAMSAAVTWDYHYNKSIKAGVPEPMARANADSYVLEVISETAQPSVVSDKSMFELRQGNIAKLAFMYASDPRQKTAMLLEAWGKTLTGKATKQDLQVLVLSHLVLGPMIQAIRNAMMDAKDDDEEEFTDKHWANPWEWLKSVVMGPLGGIPLLADIASGFKQGNSAVGRFQDAGSSAAKLLDGPPDNTTDEAEWRWNQIRKVMMGMDAGTGTAASIADQAVKVADNFHTTAEEAGEQRLRADAKKEREKKETKRESMTDEQREADDKRRKDRRERKVQRAAERDE